MPVTMSEATIDDSTRQNLLNSNVDGVAPAGGLVDAILDGATQNLVGVTAEFAQHVSSEIESYSSEIKDTLSKLEAVESNSAYQGSGVKAALEKFITGVRDVSYNYLDALAAAEKQIVNSVQQAYQTQDTDIASDMNADTANLEDNKVSGV